MSSNYKPGDVATPHFVTFSDVGRVDIFSRGLYKEIIPDRLRYCIKQEGLNLHAWVIMTNHVNLIISSDNAKNLTPVAGYQEIFPASTLSKTSRKISRKAVKNACPPAKAGMLNTCVHAGRSNDNNKDIQFWKQDYHPIALNRNEKLKQRLRYLYQNPVESGLLWESWHYKYSKLLTIIQMRKSFYPLCICNNESRYNRVELTGNK